MENIQMKDEFLKHSKNSRAVFGDWKEIKEFVQERDETNPLEKFNLNSNSSRNWHMSEGDTCSLMLSKWPSLFPHAFTYVLRSTLMYDRSKVSLRPLEVQLKP